MDQHSIVSIFKNHLPDQAGQKLLDDFSNGQDIELEQLSLTSLKMVEIAMELEEEHELEIDIENFEECKMMSEFVALCQAEAA